MKRSIQAQKRREKIIESARELLAQKDISRISVSEIAQKAGCTPGNIYHYFNSKEDIFFEFHQEHDSQYELVFSELLKKEKKDYQEKISVLVEFITNVIEISSADNTGISAYIYALQNPGNNALQLHSDRRIIEMYSSFLNSIGEEDGVEFLYPVNEIVNQLIIIGRGILVDWLINGKCYSISQTTHNIMLSYLNGVILLSKKELPTDI